MASKLYGVNATIIIFVFVLYCILLLIHLPVFSFLLPRSFLRPIHAICFYLKSMTAMSSCQSLELKFKIEI